MSTDSTIVVERTVYKIYNDLFKPNRLVASKMKNEDGWYILHHVCEKEYSPGLFINILTYDNPKAIQTKTDCGDLPLFLSLRHNHMDHAAFLLLIIFPQGAQQVDEDGLYPLYMALRYDQSAAVALHLLDLFPDAAKHRHYEYNDYYPLHLACMDDMYEAVVVKLLEIFPEATQYKSCDGNYPLHYGVKYLSESVVVKLIEIFPQAIQLKNKADLYPLHCACHSHAHLLVIKLLIVHYPDALIYVDQHLQKTPLDWAQYLPFYNVENVQYLKEVTAKYRKEQNIM